MDGLAAKVRLGNVGVVVSPGRPPGATARVFGFWRQQRFVEISTICVDRLSCHEVVALLAHELGHHQLGHCRRYQLLRWLGRLSFVGDGFVLTLQNSWGYEDSADRAAVEELGVSQEVLLQALRNLRSMSSIWKLERRRSHGGPHAHQNSPRELGALLAEGPSALPPRERWRQAWRLFRQQYFHAMELHYWYPPSHERDRALGAP